MSVTLSPDAKRFFSTLEKELGQAKLTPAQAEQLRKAAIVLEGGAGITNDNIERVGKELKLTPSQKSALRFAFVLDRVKPLVGGDLTEVAQNAARGLRHIVKTAESKPELARALQVFFTNFVKPETAGVGLEERVKSKGIERRDDALWIASTPPRRDPISWRMVTMETADKRFKLRASDEGTIEVGKKHGSTTRWTPLHEVAQDTAEGLSALLDELAPADRKQREFVDNALAQMPRVTTYSSQYGYYSADHGKSLGRPRGKLRAFTPKPKAVDANANDPGALKKTAEGWRFFAAKAGKLTGDGVPLDKLSLEALLRLKALVETHAGAAALASAAEGADVEIDEEAVELESLLGGVALSRINQRRALYKAAEQRLRDALQGMPVGKIDREVFLQLVGATTPGGP